MNTGAEPRLDASLPATIVPEIGFDWVMVPVAAVADAVWRILHLPMVVAPVCRGGRATSSPTPGRDGELPALRR